MKVAGYNLGCKVNKYELDAILSDFEKLEFQIVDFDDFADVYIISTCAVTALAEKKSRKYINRTKKINPNAITVALGCYIQKEFNDDKNLKQDNLLKNIDIFLGTKDKSKVKEYVLKMIEEKKQNNKDAKDSKKEIHAYDVKKLIEYENQVMTESYDMTRAYVKIQDGCNNFCTYCIIPYLRGRERSRKLEDILNEIEGLEKNGVKEIVLTGIEVAAYGKDLGDIKLIDVIEEVANREKIKRIRLSSLEQGIIDEEFLTRLSKIEKFCPHFHLSLQSGSDTVLKRMNRKYTCEKYFKKVELIRKHFENAAITTDIIVGFPEETEEEFKETLKFAKDVNFSDIHVFPYSIRTGTIAAKMNQLDQDIKVRRTKELLTLKYDMIKNFENKNLNLVHDVLIEQECMMNEKKYYVGHTKNFIKVLIEKDLISENKYDKERKDLINEIVKVKLTKVLKEEMIGEILWED